MTLVAVMLASTFSILAALHAAWAFGSVWPCKDEFELARTVAGFREVDAMPPRIASAAVAILLSVLALLPLSLAGVLVSPPEWRSALDLVGSVVATILLFRGAIGYLPAWRRLTPVEPFAALDRVYYSPLCLILGLGVGALSF